MKIEIPKILSPMIDVVFKLLFGTEGNKELLMDFLQAVLNISADELEDIIIANPFLLQEYKGDKLGILDVKLKLKTGKVINIEVQIEPMPFMESRVLFYISKLITEQINESDHYETIKPVISIIITGHSLIKQSEKYHHYFGLYDIESGILLTDILGIHTLEVLKARKINEHTEKTDLLNWMKFFDAKTEEELNMLAEKSPTMKKASLRLLELSTDEKARQLYEARLKEQRDRYARERGVEKIAEKNAMLTVAKNALQKNMSIDDILDITTGLSYDEIEAMQNMDY